MRGDLRTSVPRDRTDLLARVVEGALEGVAIMTADADTGPRIVYANDALCGLTGYGADELIGSGPDMLHGPRTDRGALDELRSCLEAGVAFRGRTWYRRKDGSDVLLGLLVEPLHDDDGTITHFVAHHRQEEDARDGSLENDERRLAQERLAVAEQRTRELVEQVPAIFYEEEAGAEGETVFVSPQIEGILGVSPAEYQRQPDWWSQHLHPDDRDRMLTGYEAGLADPTRPASFFSEYRLVRPDGRVVWLNDRETLVRDEHGAPLMVRGAMFDVTAQKETEARLQDAEARYRTLVEQLPLITYVWEVDPAPGDDPAYYTSPQIGSILGYTPEEWNADPEGWRTLIHLEDRDRIMEAAVQSERTGEPFVEEYRYVHKDGHPVWVHDESVLLRRDTDGAPWLFQGVMYDITARIESEARLAAAEEQYRTLVERMPAVTYVWDARATAEDNHNYTSPQIERLLGFTAEEWESEPQRWQASLHPDDREGVMAVTAGAAETGEPWVQEFRYVHRDGREIWIHDEATSLSRDEAGRPRLFQGVMFDITERVETDRALQGSLARFRALAEGAPVGIFETDAVGNCTYVNGRWCEVAGIDAGAALESGWAEAIHPDDREDVFAVWTAAVAGGDEFDAHYRFVRPDGDVRWVRGRAVDVRDADGIVTGYVGTIDDVTDRRATEEELRLIRSAVEHTGHAVMISELGPGDGRAPVVYVNPAFTRMTGFGAADVMGRPAATFTETGREMAALLDGRPDAPEGILEARLIRNDGSRFTAEGVVSPIRDATGASSHVVAILRDVTEIREAERGLRESLEELRRADAERRVSLAQIVEAQEQELDRMAEGIEDRSLQQMTAVRMRMETLRRNLSDPAQLGALEKLEGSVEQAVGQLRGLLSELRPRELTTEGLEGAVHEYLHRVAPDLRTEVTGRVSQDPDPSQRATAFRIVQEAITSAVEVRGAARILVELEDGADGFVVRVVDDGASWSTVRSSTMGDRAGLAGGRCRSFDGGDGATVELWLPGRAPLAGEMPLRPS